jgi:hypothetical protein
MPLLPEMKFRRLTNAEHEETISRSRIIALFVEVEDSYGLMVNGETYVTREEKEYLQHAAANLPTRD